MKFRAPRTLSFLVPLVAAGIIAGCSGGSDSTGPQTPTVATVSLSETAVTLQVNFTRQLSATTKTASDSVLTGIPLTWQSDNTAVATVGSGIITGVAPGTARITVTASGKTATATVMVIPTIVASVGLSRSKATLAPDRTLQLSAEALDSLGRKIPSRTVTFSTANATIADVSLSGLVTTKAIGLTTISATAADKEAQLALNVVLPTNLSIAVQGGTSGSLLQLSSYSVKIRHTDDSLSVAAAINGATTLAGSMALADTLEFLASSSGAPSLQSRVVAARADLPPSVNVVFLPQSVAIPTGTFAGTAVGINLVAATAPCLAKSNQCLNGFYDQSFLSTVHRWPSFPIPVSMDPALDTASIWASLLAMEASVGQKLFVLSESGDNHIQVKLGLPPAGTGFTGWTTWSWDSQDRMTFATVSFAGAGPNRGLVQHEFLHALGFWHTCSWSSVMGGYGCPQASEVSAYDVAYLLLANAVYDTESSFRLPTGQMPCGLMSIGAAVPNQTQKICLQFDPLLQNTVIRQRSAP